jgi:hypothetical protein
MHRSGGSGSGGGGGGGGGGGKVFFRRKFTPLDIPCLNG